MLTKEPVVQIHQSRFCNLKCLHCYSSSGPDERQSLAVTDVLRTTAALAKAGYRRASLSGGEPVLAPGFHDLAAGLTEQGFQVAVITNGSRPLPLMQAMSAGAVQHASISFDGPEDLHDKIRGRKGSFRAALSSLERLSKEGHSCGAVLSATQNSLPHLPELVDVICAAGAAHVQLHPIASSGRARREAKTVGPELPSEALLRLVVMGRLLQSLHPKVQIQVDVLVGQALQHLKPKESDLISPLVIADDGALLPFCFDISREYAIGRLGWAGADFYLGSRLKGLLNSVADEVSTEAATNFYRELVYMSEHTKLVETD
jgi:MoaA/NifB/PqqE/SkfB family radical SAM enzyme